jgi:polyphosphate kinase
LKARFDEEANIGWARALEEAGVHVVYGIVGLKTHSKTALVLRREEDGVRHYCHVGTGNYNSKTARVYEDLGLLTADEEIGADVGELFNYLTGFSRHADYRQILVSPVTVRKRIMAMIEEQTEAGPRGRIMLKLNGLTDATMIDALYRASGAGVPIDLAVRGLCRLRPGIPELSETISVRSIVGSFLEHSRIYRFGGAPANSDDPDAGPGLPLKLYIGSADLMGRNLDRRVEVLVPIHDPELQARLFDILDLVFTDETNTWVLGPDRRWRRVENAHGISAQGRLRDLAIERARRRRDNDLRVGDDDQ